MKPTDKLPCLREVYCEVCIALWSQNITNLSINRGETTQKTLRIV